MYDFFEIMKPRKNLGIYGALLWGDIVDGKDRSAAGRIPCWLKLRRSDQISGLGFCSCLRFLKSNLKSSSRLEIHAEQFSRAKADTVNFLYAYM